MNLEIILQDPVENKLECLDLFHYFSTFAVSYMLQNTGGLIHK